MVPPALEPKMEQMDTAAVAAWFVDALGLPQYAAAVKEHEVDGFVLLELEKRDNLADLGIKGNMHQAKVRGGLAKQTSLHRKRPAEYVPGGTAVARAKRREPLSSKSPASAASA